MNTDIVITKTDVTITNENGNEIEVNSHSPEIQEI